MAHKGLREFSGEEAGGLALGQNGFHVIKGAGTTTASSKGITYWIAVKANGAAGVQARSYGSGDDLAEDGTQSASAGNNMEVADGDVIYGVFDQIYMDQTGERVLAYIGR